MEDPVEARANESEDLYDVASWEPRTALDRLAVNIHRGGVRLLRWTVYVLGAVIFLAFLVGGAGAIIIDNPFVLGLVVLSVVPAGLLALYVYRTDITTDEPATLMAATFVLSILFAGFAAVVNTRLSGLQGAGLLGVVLYYYLVVGPGEEFVKMLAVRLYAYRDDRFDSVIDGAVYGAVAGLGFATIENVLYITQNLQGSGAVITTMAVDFLAQFSEAVEAGGQITAVRSLAGPGHVIYSAFAGYYLGLAKFNRDNAVPIIIKGLIIAAFIHATYNTLVGIVPGLVSLVVPGVPTLVLFFGFVVVYAGLFLYILYRKLQRYRRTYKRVHDDVENPEEMAPDRTEFDAD
ncbi:PrsW family intramembrane metalloprotease [Natronomonas marina]|jgi:RsiW-degrading membrane proteinase PrsW (M82 family)|uniref:PrsW family intramembrane metalloprotease n=1 Tax=Natronomonas marina TaxID=2961939 RepID=UPI0020C98646|nr:PrsW family intramembrane metalloprotease [Natronomonas marina]